MATLKKNRTRIVVLAVLALLFISAIHGMEEPQDWVITILRGLSVGMVTFLVASGLSLIFGLMDVLNLAHGEMFMLGAYMGWTVFVRPDTFVDVLAPLFLVVAGFALTPVWRVLLARLKVSEQMKQVWPAAALLIALVILFFTFTKFPITGWNLGVFAEAPGTYALALDQGRLELPEPELVSTGAAAAAILGTLIGSSLLALSLVGFAQKNQAGLLNPRLNKGPIVAAALLIVAGLVVYFANDSLTTTLLDMGTTARFFLAMAVATIIGFVIGGIFESVLIRPLYDRPIYQLMLTLGVSFIVIEVVRSIWGRPEFIMPKAELFTGTGDFCPATNLGDLLTYNCSTILLFDGRIRTYNEVFIILVGLVVLLVVWLLLQRTRIGMIIRAGVQDSEMVEALGINVRQVFTFVFAMGVALASLGGVLAAPSVGLSNGMGTQYLLLALIALAIGGLTSFPGAAAGAILVGLIQQFIIKYGQIGINLPFLEEPFKPSPPLVPASVVLLMVIILLVLPQGLFGRNE